MKVLAKNRRSRYDYDITERLAAGLVLHGPEVKSIKAGNVSLKGSFVSLYNGEAFLAHAYVTPYQPAATNNDEDPKRPRKLLLQRHQIDRIMQDKREGKSIIPTALLQDRGLVKIELGIGKGKKKYDKRHDLKKRDMQREIARIQ